MSIMTDITQLVKENIMSILVKGARIALYVACEATKAYCAMKLGEALFIRHMCTKATKYKGLNAAGTVKWTDIHGEEYIVKVEAI